MNDIRDIRGLSDEEAQLRFRTEGPNELPSARPRGVFAIAVEIICQPMFLLLVAGGGIYLLLGDLQEALLLLAFVFVVIGITFNQERKTENALKALQNLSSPRARVIRGGEQKRIPGREVVRGDMVIVSEGDRVPADGVVRSATSLTVDESLLTGESVPVRKREWDGAETLTQPGGDDEPFIYSGTLVVGGLAAIEVQNTALNTQIGKIGRSLQTLKTERTALQTQTGRLVRIIAVGGGSLAAIMVVAYGLTRGDWLQGLLAGVALAMALLPEEFPMVLTIFLALGAWRISRQQVLARRMPAVEILGSATVLCVDKTGTLTLNQMSVGELYVQGQHLPVDPSTTTQLPEPFHALVEFSILASQRDPFNPMEKAFHQFGTERLTGTEHLHGDWQLVRQYPLAPELLAMSHVWRSAEGQCSVIAAKGAPEAIADLCHLSEEERQAVAAAVARMAEQGLRVLAVAQAYFADREDLPVGQHDFEFKLVGLVGLTDPVRPGVPAAIKECYGAGIRVVMITGDYPATARNIAAQIGLNNPGLVIAGDELAAMSDAELQERIGEVNTFARVVPEQKLRLVQALKARGEVVAMTGDGVNDAPALKASDIGVAMGARGTDVAREAAGLVLLDDDFASIVAAVRLGRRIFDNLRKAMSYIFSIHVPIAGLSFIPVVMHWPLILVPIHIVLMELIIDPACSTVFEAEPEEADAMTRPPRAPRESIFDRRVLRLSLLQGLSILIVSLGVFVACRRLDLTPEAATMAFTSLVAANLALILINVSWTRSLLVTLRSPNQAMWWIIGGASMLMGLMLYVPFLSKLLGFSRLSVAELGVCLAAGLASVVWFEFWKLAKRRRGSRLREAEPFAAAGL